MYIDITTKEKEIFEKLKTKFNYTNPLQAPKIEKIIVSTGVGSTNDKKKIELIEQRLAQITGQKPSTQLAKKSIAQFKVREGQLSGYKVTLRGKMARDFLAKIIHIALPRTRDFRGLSKSGVDEMGNYSFGIKESTIFPETSDEELKNVFGMSVTIVTNSKNKEETLAFLEHIGLPFKKS
ncbi:MAG TPA: 50S ribosomal protein L5 [Candidatus Paceibacterota bacterium]|nr:50S ribosomal protein L5 [Candidatus Paceibacterota bacterium]HMP19187.1 50S ribosomal protein L5 [Candidatus Paceibacterota bacterium]HMP85282.1 50S ribosomal protein L5 [Candidatus Paceibacterota bacterium]